MENIDQQIERFLDGEMADAEANAFEQKALLDPELHTAIEDQKDIRRVLRIRKHQTDLNMVAGIQARMIARKKRTRQFLFMASAAALALVAAAFIFLFSNNKILTDAYMDRLPYTSDSDVQGVGAEAHFVAGKEAFDRKEYATALEEMGYLTPESEVYPEASVYIGMAHLRMHDYAAARQILENNLEEVSGTLAVWSQWYLSLALIGQDQPQEALVLLDKLASDPQVGEMLEEAITDLKKELDTGD